MRPGILHRRSLTYHWRTNVGVVLGVAVGTAVLTGALIVGDSMRGSLHEAALGRLGRVDQALVSSRFFREALATEMADSATGQRLHLKTCSAILLSGGSVHADSQARSNRISILGVNERFWRLSGEGAPFPQPTMVGRSVVLNEPLATELGASVGDDVLLRIGKPSAISTETLLGRRDDTTTALRLAVGGIIPAEDIGAFSLNPRQFLPRNAYVSLHVLQRALNKPDRVNTILVAADRATSFKPGTFGKMVQELAARTMTLTDYGLSVRAEPERGYLALESVNMLIPPSVGAVVSVPGESRRFRSSGVLTYLANTISIGSRTSGIPYSVVTAIDPASPAAESLRLTDGGTAASLEPGEVILNEWAADDLGAEPGASITLSYYVTGEFGRLETRSETFTLRGVVALEGAAADTGFTPEYEGVTDTQNLADWDPPFPMDLALIRDEDEAYWDTYHATPKAFVSLEDGLRLWAHDGDRLGRLTSVRIYPNKQVVNYPGIVWKFEQSLLNRIDPAQLDLEFESVRERMTEASKGSTDFGGLFIGFSFFLIASAAMLVALLFRLSVEQRASEIGLKLAVGISPSDVRKHAITEGSVLALIGCVIGVVAAIGYAWLMLAGLRTWWSDAVNTPFLALHVSEPTVAIGFAAGFLLALGSIVWSLRGLLRSSARSLLAGSVAADDGGTRQRTGKAARITSRLAFLLAAGATASPYLTDAVPKSIAFFLGGAAMLVAGLSMFAGKLRSEPRRVIDRPGNAALWRLGLRNARRRAGRSILTAGLIASATFLVTALQAFHVDAGSVAGEKSSGTGGFTLYAESTVPLVYDLNTPFGREKLGLPPETSGAIGDASIIAFRLRPGDESSCLNLYKPTSPRILGAGSPTIERGGFTFSKTLAESPGEIANPWLLLNHTFDDGAIPVIGDESAVLWQLQLGLGKDLVIADESGRDVRLRFVALLGGSVLQDELIVAESHFVDMFPSVGGYAFFLIDAPEPTVTELEGVLERELSPFGFDVGLTRTRLANYLAVQNTYLSTFQSLGGFGLLLGSIGLAAVLLRNVWERRAELALMRAVGFSQSVVGCTVLAENAALLLIGLSTGLLAALVAIAPHIVERPSTLPWLSVGLTLAAVFATGLVTGGLTTFAALRAPLIPALRAE